MKIVCLLALLGMLLGSAMAGDAGGAALDFLGKVKEGRVDLNPGVDTALLGQITDRKRESIRKRLERMKAELTGGELELGDVKQDGLFAAAMIRKSAGFDSAEVRVFPVALVKRGGKWLPAPLPASFENAVAGYTLPMKTRLSALEEWMMRKRVTDLEKMLVESTKRTREVILNSIIGEELEGDDLGKITDRFLEACAKGDRAAILGFLGGLSDPLPADWSLRLKASKEAVGGKGNWRVLASPEVIRVRVHEEKDQKAGLVSLAWLDPQTVATSGVHVLHLNFSRDTAGQWAMDLPDVLLHGGEFPDDEDFDQDLLSRFAERLRVSEPALYSDSLDEAAAGLMESLRSGGVREALRKVDLGGGRRNGLKAVTDAAELWWSLNEPGVFRIPVELGFKQEGDLAVYAYQWFSVSDPDRFGLRTLFFRKMDYGWLWSPGPPAKSGPAARKELVEWVAGMEPEWRLSWRQLLMKPSAKLDRIIPADPPTDEQIKALVKAWLAALVKKDLGAALATTAWLGRGAGEIPMKALRNISYELANADEGKAELVRIHRSASWAAVTVRRVSGERVQDLFLPVVSTPSGVRLLPEIDLIAETTRTRSFLNKASFEMLGKAVDEESITELKGLFEDSHQIAK